VLVTNTCNPSYLGACDQKVHGLRPDGANSFWDLIFKITRAKWTGSMVQAAERLLRKHKVQPPVPPKRQNKTKNKKPSLRRYQRVERGCDSQVANYNLLSATVKLYDCGQSSSSLLCPSSYSFANGRKATDCQDQSHPGSRSVTLGKLLLPMPRVTNRSKDWGIFWDLRLSV
jgi:hypothetical protein